MLLLVILSSFVLKVSVKPNQFFFTIQWQKMDRQTEYNFIIVEIYRKPATKLDALFTITAELSSAAIILNNNSDTRNNQMQDSPTEPSHIWLSTLYRLRKILVPRHLNHTLIVRLNNICVWFQEESVCIRMWTSIRL